MKQLTCEMCGSNNMVKQDGMFVCQDCGTKYSVEEARKMMVEGTVRVDNSHMIENYLEMARNAKDAGNNTEAETYCNKAIEIDPNNYKAWMIKGEAAAWQSTLQNSRIDEGVSAFAKGITNAPEEEREELTEYAKEQIKRLSTAMVSLRADRFAKWPDAEESAGFISDLTSILGTVVNFLTQTGSLIPVSEIMAPIATQINQSVVKAYQSVIKPEYKSDRYPWPDDDDFRKYIERIGYCTTLVEKAINLCDDDDDEDIQRYENLVFLHKEAINACSYDSQYADLDEQWKVNLYSSKPGLYPVARENRVYFKNLSLTDTAVASRNNLIRQYESKVRELKSAKERRIAAEKAEKERKAKEEAKKRFDDYWAEHADDKARLESEQKGLQEQIAGLKASQNDQIAALNKEIAAIPGQAEIDNLDERIKKLTDEKASLGIFKGKEKKALQEQIDQATAEKKAVQDRMIAAKKEIEGRISAVKSEIQKKLSPLQSRVNSINTELTKAR